MSYAIISKFGQNNSANNDPLTYCLTQTVDTEFNHPTTPENFGPYSRNCQFYMAERCSKDWDGYCEYASYNRSKSFPNQAQERYDSSLVVSHDMSNGESLIRNAAQRRFCTFTNCYKKQEPFDPNVANSPNVYYWTNEGLGNCVPVCSVDPDTIDQDPLMDKLLNSPKIAPDILANICNTSQRKGINLTGTKIGNFCQKYQQEKARVGYSGQVQAGSPLATYSYI